jgi:hypothetical protein
MSRVTPFPDNLTRELSRLHSVESAALLSHDVPTFVHSRLRWCELIITLCPGLAAAAPALARRVAPLLPGPPEPVPRWKLELRARPLVLIVRRTVRTITSPGGGRSQTAEEYLACGHVHRVTIVLPGDLRRRRRRCRECGAALLEARARREVTQIAAPLPSVSGNSVRKGGRGESPEPLCGAARKQLRPCLVRPR